jgi:addiction module HigA family antidote
MLSKLLPITPGEILLEEFIKPFGINQAMLASAIRVPANRINQIVRGEREISANTALRLGKYFNIEPEFWLNLQTRYNLKIAMDDKKWLAIEMGIHSITDTDDSENKENSPS